MEAIVEYLKTLSKNDLLFILKDKISGGVHTDTAGCDPPCSGAGSTPNGHWSCNNGNCVWIPAL